MLWCLVGLFPSFLLLFSFLPLRLGFATGGLNWAVLPSWAFSFLFFSSSSMMHIPGFYLCRHRNTHSLKSIAVVFPLTYQQCHAESSAHRQLLFLFSNPLKTLSISSLTQSFQLVEPCMGPWLPWLIRHCSWPVFPVLLRALSLSLSLFYFFDLFVEFTI